MIELTSRDEGSEGSLEDEMRKGGELGSLFPIFFLFLIIFEHKKIYLWCQHVAKLRSLV